MEGILLQRETCENEKPYVRKSFETSGCVTVQVGKGKFGTEEHCHL